MARALPFVNEKVSTSEKMAYDKFSNWRKQLVNPWPSRHWSASVEYDCRRISVDDKSDITDGQSNFKSTNKALYVKAHCWLLRQFLYLSCLVFWKLGNFGKLSAPSQKYGASAKIADDLASLAECGLCATNESLVKNDRTTNKDPSLA